MGVSQLQISVAGDDEWRVPGVEWIRLWWAKRSEMAGHVLAALGFVASRVNDGTSSNTVGNLVAVFATIIAAAVMGFTLWYAFEAFRAHKGKFKQAMPEMLGIVASGAVLSVVALKIPNMFGYGQTFLSDILPF